MSMTVEAAITRLADRALEAVRDDDDRLSIYQAMAIAFAGVCEVRSKAAEEAALALLAAEAAQLKFRELLRSTITG